MGVKKLAVDAVAPEAAAATAAGSGARKRPRRGSGSTPATKPEHIPTTDEVNAGVTSADLERQSAAPAPTSSGAGVALPPAVSTGSGFLLGVFAWAVGLAYLQGGSDGVKKFFAAKFFNKV